MCAGVSPCGVLNGFFPLKVKEVPGAASSSGHAWAHEFGENRAASAMEDSWREVSRRGQAAQLSGDWANQFAADAGT